MFHRYPFVFIFLTIAALILSAYYFKCPFSALYDTEFALLDTLSVYRVQVLEEPSIRAKSTRARVRLIDYDKDAVFFFYHQSTNDINGRSAADNVIRFGDVIEARTTIRLPAPRSPQDFDYGRYLRLNHMVGAAYVYANNWRITGHEPPRGIRQQALAVRHRLLCRFEELGFEGEELAVLCAITLGERSAMTSDLRQSFAAAGASHVLAVSGLHTGIIFGMVWAILTLFGRFTPRYKHRLHALLLAIACTLTMTAYAFLTGLNPPVVRAVIMIAIMQFGTALHRQVISVNTLAAAAVCCLMTDPLTLFSVSFQLSFSAVLAIILIVPPLSSSLFPSGKKWISIGHYQIAVNNKVTRYIISLLCMSLAAQVGTMPFVLYYYGQFANYFLLTNLVVVPLASFVIVPFGFLTLAMAHTAVAPYLATISGWSVKAMCDYTKWVESLPLSTTLLDTNLPMMMCLTAAFVTTGLAFGRKNLWWLTGTALSMAVFCLSYIFIR